MGTLRSLNRIGQLLGADVSHTVTALRYLPRYFAEYGRFKALLHAAGDNFPLTKLYPCPFDRVGDVAEPPSQYLLQDLFVANRVYRNNPSHHVDVGSRIDGFVTHLASFREVEVLDIRPLSPLPFHVTSRQVDLTSGEFALQEYCDSASCLHALEHFGLGRYGDALDADGHKKGLANLHRMLKSGGTLYLSVPIGPQRIEFNAHRVFGIGYLLELLRERFDVLLFSLIDDSGRFYAQLPLDADNVARNFDCTYGCGIFELRKR